MSRAHSSQPTATPVEGTALDSAESERSGLDRRILILAPDGTDAADTKTILDDAAIASLVCPDAEAFVREAAAGAGALLVTDDAIAGDGRSLLSDLLANQPPWSDLPAFILTRQTPEWPVSEDDFTRLWNVAFIERPVRVATIVSALRTALRARERQYDLRDRLQAGSLLAAIVESSDDAIISKTLDGTIVSWNAGAERLFGYSADEAVGQSITLLIPADMRDEERQILERLRRGERIDHYETVRITKNGKPVEISLSISPIRDSTNRIVGASKVARDITQWRQAEQALRDADRRKDEFVATLAHELRNPLAPILNALHVLRATTISDPAVLRVREILERQVNHMIRLVDDLLEMSRITRGAIELRNERVELAAVIGNAVETSKPLIDGAGHELVLAIPDEPLVLDADPVRIGQVFANLLNNAAKYSEPGGTIWVTAQRNGTHVAVSVKDAGIGIAADMLPRVFEMFAQAEAAVHHARGGLGIGLTLVRRLVHMHGGTVEAHSAGPGSGSEFIVRLPLAAPAGRHHGVRLAAEPAAARAP